LNKRKKCLGTPRKYVSDEGTTKILKTKMAALYRSSREAHTKITVRLQYAGCVHGCGAKLNMRIKFNTERIGTTGNIVAIDRCREV
jgi:hypothetical protein